MAKKKSSSKNKKQAPDFEASLAELESIVGKLESGEIPLAEAIAEYEKGVSLLKECHGALSQVQRKIELLTNVDENGEEKTVPFESGADSDESIDNDEGRLF